MPDRDPETTEGSREVADAYSLLGLETGATMREIEAAYWRFARNLKGQSEIGRYTAAYETLVNSVRPPERKAREATPAPSVATPERGALPVRPRSKFNWRDR